MVGRTMKLQLIPYMTFVTPQKHDLLYPCMLSHPLPYLDELTIYALSLVHNRSLLGPLYSDHGSPQIAVNTGCAKLRGIVPFQLLPHVNALPATTQRCNSIRHRERCRLPQCNWRKSIPYLWLRRHGNPTHSMHGGEVIKYRIGTLRFFPIRFHLWIQPAAG